jgi:2-polyprenyl-6-methoxyphenol hydroxylase-like FAD-dependent oxidoreductase
VEETRRLGATIQLNSEVRGVDFKQTSVILASGEKIHADAIIGADGMSARSSCLLSTV